MLADLISEGTREGLESARARGRSGGRKPKLTTRYVSMFATVAGSDHSSWRRCRSGVPGHVITR
jgi:hypothetical protein